MYIDPAYKFARVLRTTLLCYMLYEYSGEKLAVQSAKRASALWRIQSTLAADPFDSHVDIAKIESAYLSQVQLTATSTADERTDRLRAASRRVETLPYS